MYAGTDRTLGQEAWDQFHRIRAALANAVLTDVDGDYARYVGTDDRGIELEIGIVPDDRFAGQFAAIHCMPTEWRNK